MEGQILVEVSDRTWEKEIEKADGPALVMFYSPTCPHCRNMEPYFKQYAEEYAGLVLFARLDISTSQWIAERYGVRSTPTFKFFCNGKPVSDLVGAVYPALLKRMIDEGLKTGQECLQKSTIINYDITGYG
ncbi:MAG TPA: thioredoxin family protein [Methanoregulaceae archaeon]|nr:thioredoxin family protein [Methanoregulaceae archaeon]